MPFEAASPDYQQAAQHATSVAAARIQETNHFTLVSASEIQRLRQAGQSIEGYVDALFTGQITYIGSRVYQTRTNGGKTVEDGLAVEVHFNYSLTLVRDGTLIGPINRKGAINIKGPTSMSGAMSSVPSRLALNFAAQIIDKEMELLGQDVAPYILKIDRELEWESNKKLWRQMEAALAQVKKGNYQTALDSYISIYNTHQSIAAAINASILYEALGETQTAADFMQSVVAATGDPKARNVLARLNNDLQEVAGSAEYDDIQNQKERVAGYVNQEMMRSLPANARVWIHNNTLSDQGMMHDRNIVNDVIDDLTVAFLRNGITVVDRASIALIMSELDFQMSGYVSERDLVSIGNLAGANTIIILNVTGAGAMRRLQVRILDIERGVPVFQSDTSEHWRL